MERREPIIFKATEPSPPNLKVSLLGQCLCPPPPLSRPTPKETAVLQHHTNYPRRVSSPTIFAVPMGVL